MAESSQVNEAGSGTAGTVGVNEILVEIVGDPDKINEVDHTI